MRTQDSHKASRWADTASPVAIGALGALVVVLQGGAPWTLLALPASCWGAWQLARWFGGRLALRALLSTVLVVAVFVFFDTLFGVDTARLHKAVAEAGIAVEKVFSERDAVIISIRPVSWGPERNEALRAIFAATHKHAQSKKRVLVQWGDAMTSTAQMNDIKDFVAGRITYREILNRLEWSGTPDVLPDDDSLDDSARNQALWPVQVGLGRRTVRGGAGT